MAKLPGYLRIDYENATVHLRLLHPFAWWTICRIVWNKFTGWLFCEWQETEGLKETDDI